jgi:hypothetical protein
MTQRFQGWVPPAPVSETIWETGIIEITHLNFDGGNDTLITNAYFDHYLYPETLPERISVILTEPFLGVAADICVGRVSRVKEEKELYLKWVGLPQKPHSFQQRPESMFLPPDGSNKTIRLTVRVRGDNPPSSGRILFFIKTRAII